MVLQEAAKGKRPVITATGSSASIKPLTMQAMCKVLIQHRYQQVSESHEFPLLFVACYRIPILFVRL